MPTPNIRPEGDGAVSRPMTSEKCVSARTVDADVETAAAPARVCDDTGKTATALTRERSESGKTASAPVCMRNELGRTANAPAREQNGSMAMKNESMEKKNEPTEKKNGRVRLFYGFDTLPHFVHPAVTVGSYDGVHRGHRALIERLVTEARAQGGESIVMTFEPHPRITLGRAEGLRLLTTLEEKIALLADLGVDNVIVIPFDRSFSALSGREFVDRYLIERVGAETLVAGFNHRFGHDGLACDDPSLNGLLRVICVGPCTVGDIRVSSTAVRRLVDAGDLRAAEQLLGHPLSASLLHSLAPGDSSQGPAADRMTADSRNTQPAETPVATTTNL